MSKDRHVALLRGINVGGRNKLPMKELVALVEGLGAREVTTYIQSGNVVFSATPKAVRALPKRLTAAIDESYGYAVPVVLRSAAELRRVVEGNPFLAAGVEPKALHVAFLAAEPSPAAVASLDPARSPPDALEVRGAEVYLHLPNGMARTKLSNAYLDRALATVSTVRNWNTVLELLARAGV